VLTAQLKVQENAVVEARKAVTVYLNQYRAGAVAFTSVVVAEAALLSAEQAALATRQNLFIASVTLIEALGGGWTSQGCRRRVKSRRESRSSRSFEVESLKLPIIPERPGFRLKRRRRMSGIFKPIALPLIFGLMWSDVALSQDITKFNTIETHAPATIDAIKISNQKFAFRNSPCKNWRAAMADYIVQHVEQRARDHQADIPASRFEGAREVGSFRRS